MRADSLGDLAEAAREHPALLEPSADDEIGARAEAAIDEGNDQLAQAIEARREALADMRAELTGETTLMHAIQTLVRAGDHEEALAEAISTYPVLLTDAAQEALFRLAAESRTRGDDALAERAVEYREWLRSVREGLEGDS
jgi:signal transduction histidine kinase